MPVAPPDRRQAILLGLCATAAVLIVVAFWMALRAYGDTGVHWVPSTTAYVQRIESIDPGSPGETAGLRVGDLLDTRALTPAERLRFFAGEPVDVRIVLPIQRGNERRSIALTPWHLTESAFWHADGWDQVLSIVGELWQVFVAALLLWRRPKNVEVQLLAMILFVSQLGVAIAAGLNNWISPWPALDAVLYAISPALVTIGPVLLATYALQFGRPISRWRIIATWTAYAFAAFTSVAGMIGAAGQWFGFIDWPTWFINQSVPSVVLAVFNSLLPLACAAFAIRSAHSNERGRLAWVVASLSLNYIASVIFTFTSTSGVATHFGILFVDISVFIAPLGLTYAILNRQLVDIGFALNRAAIFTVISLLVVGTFSLVEWALGGWLQNVSKTTNLVVSAALALALGLSIHPIQIWVDRFVDRIFFRKRHDDEVALRRFAHEAAYTTDPGVIVERAKAEILDHTDCTFCDIVLADELGRYGDIDENDRALVALRATAAPVDLHAMPTVLRGERAYPMLARGRLVGTIVVGPKRSGEKFAPDESAAIAEVAHGVGIALDLLGTGRDAAIPQLIDAVAKLERNVHDLRETLTARFD
jgi:hypothetical protein